jgi:hypothetical protein
MENDQGNAAEDQTAYVPVGEAARILAVSRGAISRRIRDAELACFQDPRDRRQTLVRKTDIDELRSIRPVAPRTKKAATTT